MLVFKFGGASVKNAEAIQNVGSIVGRFIGQPLVVVVSAMDKTTNALEALAHLASQVREAEALERLERVRNFHSQLVRQLFAEGAQAVLDKLEPFYLEIDRLVRGIALLQYCPPRAVERIMSFGELLSSTILVDYLNRIFIPTDWLDARELIVTDSKFEQADIIWGQTIANLQQAILPVTDAGRVAVVPGYIARNTDGLTVTLGREGSDFTAAIVAHALDAEQMNVWKDVPGILNGDPRLYPDAQLIPELTYERTIEMTFFGAKVLHPRTLKPLFSKGIPLAVRSFLEPAKPGTLISTQATGKPGARMDKELQALIRIRPRDYSFIAEEGHLGRIFAHINDLGLTVNLTQSSALTLTLCLDYKAEPVHELMAKLQEDGFDTTIRTDLRLITRLQGDPEPWPLPGSKVVLIQQDELGYRAVLEQ
jgi:aspartate kinase